MDKNLPDDWTEEQNAIFTRVYKFLIANAAAVQHPRAAPVAVEHWQTIAHNAAWVAAELRDCEEVRILDGDTEEVIAASPTSGTLN